MPIADTDVAHAAATIIPDALQALGLQSDELQALARNGHVASAVRGRRSRIYELRFRVGGRQRRRYLGVNAAVADAVQVALKQWQAVRRAERELRVTALEAGRLMRAAQRKLAGPLSEANYQFHGRTVRRVRNSKKN